MIQDLIYLPVFRARQQEIIVLKETNFDQHAFPLIEIIKEKDRKSNPQSTYEIYAELIASINAQKILIDIPSYLRLTSGTNNEVVAFMRSVAENMETRINFLDQFHDIEKVIPVISSLIQITGETNTIRPQFLKLSEIYPNIAFRTFHNTFERDIDEIRECMRAQSDILIYDLDTIAITSPVLRIHRAKINQLGLVKKVLIRSAVNSDIQNVTLEHGQVVADADNSLVELYLNYGFNAFGDYVGIKKDDLTSGGTISPGFIIYDPYENWYYGYKGEVKRLSQFEDRIVPEVLNSQFIQNLRENFPDYIEGNMGIAVLQSINAGDESGKSQAKFKKIAMEHYLHCILTKLARNHQIPLSQQ